MMLFDRIELLISGAIERLFRGRSAFTPDGLARDLRRALDGAAVDLVGKVYAPNAIEVHLAAADLERLGGIADRLERETAAILASHAEGHGYAMVGPLELKLFPEPEIAAGGIRIRLEFRRRASEETANAGGYPGDFAAGASSSAASVAGSVTGSLQA